MELVKARPEPRRLVQDWNGRVESSRVHRRRRPLMEPHVGLPIPARTRELSATLRDDLRTALRSIRRRPAFSITVATTLAIAIGATVGVFGVIDRLLIRP